MQTTRNLPSSSDRYALCWGDRAFSVAVPRIRNSLPYNIRQSPAIPAFKASLKSHLFTRIYCMATWARTVGIPSYKCYDWLINWLMLKCAFYLLPETCRSPDLTHKCILHFYRHFSELGYEEDRPLTCYWCDKFCPYRNQVIRRERALRKAAERRELDKSTEATFVDIYAGSSPSVNEELKDWLSPSKQRDRVLRGGKAHPKEKELQKLKGSQEQSPKASKGVDQPDGVGESDSLLSSEEEDMRSEEGEEVQGRQERRPKKPRKKRGIWMIFTNVGCCTNQISLWPLFQ